MINNTLLILCASSLILSACASNKRPDRRAQHDPERMERMYQTFVNRWDFNEDGKATCDDISVQRSRLFRRLDEDNNGVLSSREFRHARFEDKSFMFFTYDRVDTNASASIDLDEFMTVAHSQFLGMDQDNDCLIDRREALTAMRERNPDVAREKKSKGKKGGRGGGEKRNFTAD